MTRMKKIYGLVTKNIDCLSLSTKSESKSNELDSFSFLKAVQFRNLILTLTDQPGLSRIRKALVYLPFLTCTSTIPT